MSVCWRQGQCRKTDLTSASCSWMQQCRHVAQCLHCCTTTYTFDAPVVHENKHESVCCYFIKLVSKKKKKIGARVLAWPLTLTCLRCAHMLALYLQWRLFLIILHNVAAVINSPEFEGKTCPNQGFCVLSNKSCSCLTSLDSFQENAETRVEIMVKRRREVQQCIKCRKNICGSQNCDYSGKICCEKHNFVCETPVLPLGFNV